MEQVINVRFGELQSTSAAEVAELRDELAQVNEKVESATSKLQRDIDELRGPKKRRRRRRAQAAQTCADARIFQVRTDEAMDACCPAASSGGKGHRRLQADCALPDTCPSAECASAFTSFFEDCTDMLGASELARLRGFYASCQQLDSDAQLMLDGSEPAMIFHVLVLDDASAQAQSMFGGGSGGGGGKNSPLLGPAPPLAGEGGAVAVEEFQAVCTKANLATCAPQCGATTHGYLLSIQIDGRGTVMTCNIYDTLFSWQGQASLGGYIGADVASFFSSVVSGAAGTFMLTLTLEDAGITTPLIVRPGQTVAVTGDAALNERPNWGDAGFVVQQRAALTITHVLLRAALSVAGDGASLDQTLSTAPCTPQSASLRPEAAPSAWPRWPCRFRCGLRRRARSPMWVPPCASSRCASTATQAGAS